MSEASPEFPPELVELILRELRGSKRDLASCSLVCRGWMVLAKNQMTLRIGDPQTIPGFIDLVQSPTSSLSATTRRLRIRGRHFQKETVPLRVLEMLPQFSQLQHLTLWCRFPDLLPVRLPVLTRLFLSGIFPSYSTFARFMTGFPALQDLTLCEVAWNFSPDEDDTPTFTFPSLELKSASFSWEFSRLAVERRIENIILSLWTPRVIVAHRGPTTIPLHYLKTLSKYLQHLGGHLQYLVLPRRVAQNDFSMLDFSHSSNLRHLKIHQAVTTMNSLAWALPELEPMLANIGSCCSLEILILTVRVAWGMGSSWLPLPQFLVELLDKPQFASIQEIRFAMHGSPVLRDPSVQQNFESTLIAALPKAVADKLTFIKDTY
ncbi:hypothetical protein B0H16DRAFT_468683 [Mycena metata]|uniref:F-box domain-containing protein n=1 Tax=Mycena metata TaxID=1033252 RepID=A0AAD7KCB4_9AGAR|nr:hypothetical protein B0H16DRAFT_468683 [Mycena metata]